MPPVTRRAAATPARPLAGEAKPADVTCHRIALRDAQQHCMDERQLAAERHQHQLRMTAMIYATVGILLQFVATVLSLGTSQMLKGVPLLLPLCAVVLLGIFAITSDYRASQGLPPAPARRDSAQ